MNKSQRSALFAEHWPKACSVQGWDEDSREQRLKVLSLALGRRIESASEINETSDYDKVKAYLLFAQDKIAGAMEVDNPELGDERRLRVVIEEYLACLALYHPNPKAYWQVVLKNRFRGVDVDDMPLGTLKKAVYTIARCVDRMRAAAGESVKEMEARAGLDEVRSAECGVQSSEVGKEEVEAPF